MRPGCGATCAVLWVLCAVARAFELTADRCPTNCAGVEHYCTTVAVSQGGVGRVKSCSQEPTLTFECSCNDGAAWAALNRSADGTCAVQKYFHPPRSVGDSAMCTASTGRCPSSCNDAIDRFSLGCVASTAECGGHVFSCMLCSGDIYSIEFGQGNNGDECDRRTEPSTHCDADVDCFGHGCCQPPQLASQCLCYEDDVNGFWDGDRCNQCDTNYGGNACKERKAGFQIFVDSIGDRVLTITFPFVICIFLFVLVNILRRRWNSDVSPNLLRREFGQQGVFKSKAIPPRPANSKGMMARRARETEGMSPSTTAPNALARQVANLHR